MRFASRTIATLSVVAVSALALTGCVASASQPSDSASKGSSDTILLGAAMAETGFMSVVDAPALNAMKMAITQLNEKGGIDGKHVELRVIDTGSNLDKYAPASQQLIDAGAKAIILTCDFDLSSPGALAAGQANVMSISPCIGDALFGPKGGLNLSFSMGNSTIGEGVVMAEFAQSKGWKKGVFLTDTSLKYTQSQCAIARKRFIELGGTDVGSYNYVQGDSIPEIVSKITGGTAPDVVFNCGYNPGGAKAAKDLRAGGIAAPIISGFGMDGTFWLDAIPGLSDYYVTTYVSTTGDDPDPAVNKFADLYASTYGQRPVTGSFVTGPSVLDALVKGHEIAGSWNGDKLAKAFENFKDEKFLVGDTTFTPQLHIGVDRSQSVLVVKDGTLKFVERRAPEKINVNG
ncbi:ABC transporter substrate-binding protein [Arthrobacter sp. MI7-26]|uniref:ABC transporter substrate-binding protein n=1 Tax=Arthrobacter sp. MI7-26 TaxID=2993653 RepID=UPI0022490CF2|nr:ABC transporter substrate-binding protein [Arthrobacter sp. MI7-26]MCX2749909.1 ABC transporter substrate-binding protein [Arthrobacter sp. MI7-26]